jgi:hypothetical protein
MRAVVHVVVGLALMGVAAVCAWVAMNVNRAPDAKLPLKIVRIVSLGSDRSREDWLRRLRISYGGMAVILVVGAILLWVTA